MLGWGLIGASTIAREWMIPAINAQPDGRVVAVTGGDPERVARYAADQGIPRLLAQFHDAFTIPHAGTGLELHGTDGSLLARDVMTQRPVGTITLRQGATDETIDPGPPENLYERSVRRFIAATRGDGPPAATADDGLRSLAVALAAQESAATGHATPVIYA